MKPATRRTPIILWALLTLAAVVLIVLPAFATNGDYGFNTGGKTAATPRATDINLNQAFATDLPLPTIEVTPTPTPVPPTATPTV